MLKLLVPFLLLLGLVGLTVLEDRPLPRADLVYSNHADVTTLDLAIMSWQQDFRVARMMYEGLTRKDVFSWDYHVEPGVAERWEVSPDGRVYTFHLRENARWSNGQPVKASDFVFAWRRVMLPDNAGDYSKLFTMIRGVEEFQDWRTKAIGDFTTRTDIKDRRGEAEALWARTLAKFDELVGVKAEDDRTLRVELIRPTAYFLDLTSFGSLYPCYEPLVKAFESVDPETGRMRTSPDWTKPPRSVSNGAFKITVWRFERDMRFEKNPYYWDRDHVALDTVAVQSIQDTNAQVMAFRTGAVDWISDVTTSYRADMLEQKQAFYREHWDEYQGLKAQGLDQIEIDRRLPPDPRKNIHAFQSFGTYFYNFNCKERLADGRLNPFHDARVRRAFAMAVDKQAIVTSVRRGGEPVATALIPPGSIGGYQSPKGVPFDPVGAKELLAEAGYPDGKGFITVDILFNKDAGHDLIAQSVAKNWSEYLGVEVTLSMKEINVVRDDLKNQNYIVSRGSWYGDYGDPTTFLDLSRSGDGNNDREYRNKAYDQLLDEAKEEADPAKRLRILERAEAMLMDEELPVLPIFHYVEVYLFDANHLTGISSHPRLEQMMQWIDVYGDGKGTDTPRVMKKNSLMLGLIVRRLLQLPVILVVIYTLTLALAWAVPGNPLENPEGRRPPAEVVEAMKAQYNLDSFWRFYFSYIKSASGARYVADWSSGELSRERARAEAAGVVPRERHVFDLGPSLKYHDRSVNEIIAGSLPVSITLGGVAILLALMIGLGAGIVGAVKPGSFADNSTLTVALVGISQPTFVIGTVLQLVFTVWLGWFAIAEWGHLRDLVLPAVTLSLPFAAYIARLTRMGMLDCLSADYIRTARAKGASEASVLLKHALKNAFLPVLSYLGPAAALAMTGSFVVERVFNVPGMGQHFVNAVQNKDLFLIIGVVLIYATMLILFNLAVDVMYRWVDPRIE